VHVTVAVPLETVLEQLAKAQLQGKAMAAQSKTTTRKMRWDRIEFMSPPNSQTRAK